MGRARSQHAHREDGGDLVEGSNEDANLTDAGGQEQGPRGLAVGFPVAKDLRTEQASWGPETSRTSHVSSSLGDPCSRGRDPLTNKEVGSGCCISHLLRVPKGIPGFCCSSPSLTLVPQCNEVQMIP